MVSHVSYEELSPDFRASQPIASENETRLIASGDPDGTANSLPAGTRTGLPIASGDGSVNC